MYIRIFSRFLNILTIFKGPKTKTIGDEVIKVIAEKMIGD